MNVLLASSKYMPEYSGSGLRAHNLYKRLCMRNAGLKVQVLCSSLTEREDLSYEYEGFSVMRIAKRPYPENGNGVGKRWRNWRNFVAAYRSVDSWLLKCQRPEIIHVFGKSYVTAATLIWARRNKIPALIELVNDMKTPFQYVPPPSSILLPKPLPERYRMICISERLHRICMKHNIPENKVWTRPNPVDEIRFKPCSPAKKMELRQKLTRFGEKDKLITYVAKYCDKKNQRFLVDVMKLLPPEYKLFLGGPLVTEGVSSITLTDYFNGLKNAVANTGLESRVQIEQGFIKNVDDYYHIADVSAFPSKSEGLGTPLLEAIACGVPVVMDLIPGISDKWIKNGANGFSCELNPATFAAKIEMAAAFPEAQRLAESEKMLAVASTSVIDADYEALLNDLLSEEIVAK